MVGRKEIKEFFEFLPSIGLKNARYGTGQYLTDIAHGSLPRGKRHVVCLE